MNFTVSGKWGVHFDTNFQVDLAIQVKRNVPASSLDLLRAKRIPHGSAGTRYDFRKLIPSYSKAHNCKWSTVDDLFELNFVLHVLYPLD